MTLHYNLIDEATLDHYKYCVIEFVEWDEPLAVLF